MASAGAAPAVKRKRPVISVLKQQKRIRDAASAAIATAGAAGAATPTAPPIDSADEKRQRLLQAVMRRIKPNATAPAATAASGGGVSGSGSDSPPHSPESYGLSHRTISSPSPPYPSNAASPPYEPPFSPVREDTTLALPASGAAAAASSSSLPAASAVRVSRSAASNSGSGLKLVSLPRELLWRVCSYLEVDEHCTLCGVNRLTNRVASDWTLWCELYVRRWPVSQLRTRHIQPSSLIGLGLTAPTTRTRIATTAVSASVSASASASAVVVMSWKRLYAQRDGVESYQFLAGVEIDHIPIYRQMYWARRRAARRARNEFTIIENWKSTHPAVGLHSSPVTEPNSAPVARSRIGRRTLPKPASPQLSSASASASVAAASASMLHHICTIQRCTFYINGDIHICELTGNVHFCGDGCDIGVSDSATGNSVCPVSGKSTSGGADTNEAGALRGNHQTALSVAAATAAAAAGASSSALKAAILHATMDDDDAAEDGDADEPRFLRDCYMAGYNASSDAELDRLIGVRSSYAAPGSRPRKHTYGH